jgi:protein-S-isoprenylcysteine O-methyltransferase Ste14
MREAFIAARAVVFAAAFVLLWSWGARLGLWGLVVFVHFGRGTAAPFDPPRAFVAVGPYRYVRNPMYIGGLTVVFGAGLALRSASIAALAVVFLGVMHLFVTLYEEPSLARRFGASYADYKGRIRRWLPKFGA